MVQEVQQQGNWYQTPNRIAGIGVSERKVSDHTQVRNEWRNGCWASTSISLTYGAEVKSSSWSISGENGVKYRAIGGKLYIPLAGTYQVRFTLENGYASGYVERFKIYNGKTLIYSYNTTLTDKVEHAVLLNLGRKNDISVSLYISGGTPGEYLTIKPKLQIVKL